MPAMILDHMHWVQLEQVQQAIDHQVAFQSDQDHFGVAEYWEPADKTGDCEDIALAKRARLIALGWQADDLRIAVVADERGGLHAVLTVDVTSQKGTPATYVMDSRMLHVEPWKTMETYGYLFMERVQPGSDKWRRLDDTDALATRLIASLRANMPTSSPVGVERQ
jgi:predicted transglutaminase-like cysteine proteinase